MKVTKESLKGLQRYIGGGAFLELENGLTFDVKVLAIHSAYGWLDYIVSPISGSGEARVRHGITLWEPDLYDDPAQDIARENVQAALDRS